MLISILFGLFTSVIFLFVFWRRLKDDYTQDQIFSTGFYIIFGIIVGSIIALNFKPSWWFWSSLSGALLGLSLGVEKYKMRMFETLEASINGELILYASFFLFDYVTTLNMMALYGHLGMLFLVALYEFLNIHYKKFSWYKSGRVGFSGLTVAGVFFILRSFVGTLVPNMPSLIGSSDVILSGIFAFISFISVYNLSRNTL